MSRTIASLHERRCRRGSDCVVSVREEEANEPRGPVRVGATKGGQFTVSKRIIDRLILASEVSEIALSRYILHSL